MKSSAFVTAAALATCALGCSGGASSAPPRFSTNWTDDGGSSIESVRVRLGAVRPALGADLVVGVGGNGDRLLGLSLTRGQKWVFSHVLDARPIVAGNFVVGSGAGEVFLLEATSGQKVWSRPAAGMELHGASDDGNVTVLVLGAPGGRSTTLLAIAHDGAVRQEIETDKALGAPVAVANVAFIPWANQYISAIHLTTGEELGRTVLREKVSRAWEAGGGLYFGELGIFRFDEHIKDAPKNRATHVSLAQRELPGSPQLMTPGNTKTPPIASAPDRIHLYARPSSPTGPFGLDGGRYYATYFRLVMGFEATGKGALAWVHAHASDVIGGDAVPGGVLLCDDQGKVTALDARTGGVVGGLDFGESIKSCVVHAGAWRAEGAVRDRDSLASQIRNALFDPDPSLMTAQRFLLRELALLEDELSTKTLVDLASDSRTSPLLLADARTALASRRNGAKFMLDALARHYDFLRGVLRGPPVGPMAQALAAMGEKSAAPALAEHLLDPASTEDDVKQASAALVVLGSEKEVPALKQFFGMYRASAENEDMGAAVANTAKALLKFGGPQGRATVEQAAQDETTSPFAQQKLQAMLAPPEEGPKAATDPAPKK
jgi:outer membrane protein assembly factor BamB